MKYRLFPLAAAVIAAAAFASCGNKSADSDSQTVPASEQAVPAADRAADASQAAPAPQIKMTPSSSEPTIAPQLKSEKGLPVVVDFYADWCGPCQQFKPIFHDAESKYAGKVDFKTVDVDAQGELADRYGIRSIPTVIFFDKEGREVYRETGFVDAPLFDAELTTLLAL